MQNTLYLARYALAAGLCALAVAATAADYPSPKEGSWIAKDFRFHTGEVMPELRLNYTTVGAPTGEPVLILHGTAGAGSSMLTPAFAGDLLPLARVSRPDPQTGCVPRFPATTTTIWWTHSTAWSKSIWASSTCG